MKTKAQQTIAVFSDTHGNTGKMRIAIRETRPDLIVHLGDFDRDAKDLRKNFPHIPLCVVCGNCDYGSQEAEEGGLTVGNTRIFITHGHNYRVRDGVDSLVQAADAQDCKIILYGHTHIPEYREIQGVTIINPGSVGIGPDYTWALLSIEDTGLYSIEIRHM